MKIYLDFDGTVVEHKYPEIGKHNPTAIYVIKKLQQAGHKIILNTYRADCNDGTLDKAVSYLQRMGIIPYAILKRKEYPSIWRLDQSIRLDEIWIDDVAQDIPLIPTHDGAAYMVDWREIDRQFQEYQIYK